MDNLKKAGVEISQSPDWNLQKKLTSTNGERMDILMILNIKANLWSIV